MIRDFMSVPIPRDIFLPDRNGIDPLNVGGVGPRYMGDYPSADDLIPRPRRALQVKGIDAGFRPFAQGSLTWRSGG